MLCMVRTHSFSGEDILGQAKDFMIKLATGYEKGEISKDDLYQTRDKMLSDLTGKLVRTRGQLKAQGKQSDKGQKDDEQTKPSKDKKAAATKPKIRMKSMKATKGSKRMPKTEMKRPAAATAADTDGDEDGCSPSPEKVIVKSNPKLVATNCLNA